MHRLITLAATLTLAACASTGGVDTGIDRALFFNGLASNNPAIGRGLNTVAKRAGYNKAVSYGTPARGSAIASDYVKRMRALAAQGRLRPFKCFGHSYGARICTILAEEAGRLGVTVLYLGLIDGRGMRPIGPNVRRVVSVRPPNWRDSTVANRVRFAPGFKGQFDELVVPGTGHVSVARDPDVVEEFVREARSF